VYSVPNSSSGTGPGLKVNRVLIYAYLHYWYMLIPVYSIRRVAAIPIPVRTTALEEAACAVDSGCLPEHMYKAMCSYCTTIVFIKQ